MDELGLRALLLVNVLIPLVFFMAAVYLALHILFARLVGNPASPVRAWLAPGTPEPRVRLLALGVYTVLWLVSRVVLVWLGTTYGG
jgi:hypothetical protein